MEIKHILVVRFRQMGDAILATPLLNTLHQNFPAAEIDFVLNERIAPLFEGHPSISRVITFSEDERHHLLAYLKKVWRIVHQTRYDVIIDMRSTVNTMLFAFFSLSSLWRIGIYKPYTRFVFNHRFEGCQPDESMIDHNLRLAEPLRGQGMGAWSKNRSLTLSITEQEMRDFRKYMQEQGIDFSRPVFLVGVTAKLQDKTWPESRMTETLQWLTETWPQLQLIFNFAPGREAENARRIYDSLQLPPSCSSNIFLNIEAKTPRQLAAMAANCTAYFGNEGGARHIVHAMGRPSLVVCSPGASKKTWLPEDDNVLTRGIAASDIDAASDTLSREEQYNLITVERVQEELNAFCTQILKEA